MSSQSKVKQEKRGCLIWGTVFFAPFFILGSGFLYAGFVAPFFNQQRSRSWETVPCEIVTSEVKRHESRDRQSAGTDYTFSIEVSFKYEYDGEEYKSDRYDLTDVFDGTEDWKREVVAELPPGAETVCYVNPENPSEAVLSRESPLSPWAAVPAGVFTLFGLAGLLFTFSILFQRDGKKQSDSDTQSPTV